MAGRGPADRECVRRFLEQSSIAELLDERGDDTRSSFDSQLRGEVHGDARLQQSHGAPGSGGACEVRPGSSGGSALRDGRIPHVPEGKPGSAATDPRWSGIRPAPAGVSERPNDISPQSAKYQ